MKKLLILLLAIFLSAGSLSAQSEDIKVFLQQQNQKGVEELIKKADKGDAKAQYQLGLIYYGNDVVPDGIPQDYAKALKYFLAVAQNNTSVHNTLVQTGLGFAELTLGRMYLEGQGTPQDYVQALKWFRLAANKRDGLAMFDIGRMYYLGLGIPQNYILAHMWFNLGAATEKKSDYEDGIGPNESMRELAAEKMTAQQIAQAQELARNWKPK